MTVIVIAAADDAIVPRGIVVVDVVVARGDPVECDQLTIGTVDDL